MIATISKAAQWTGNWLLDLVLPPRCPGCGAIVADLHSFCAPCWSSLDFIGGLGCGTCGIPLESTDAGTCAACLTKPPRIARTRAAVAYGDISRGLAIRLKYGRKVALAKAMARYMAPLLGDLPADALLVPVPLHRRRVASRGFNQSLLIAREIGRLRQLRTEPRMLRRRRPTPPLRGMSMAQRRRTVAGAFRVSHASRSTAAPLSWLTTYSQPAAPPTLARVRSSGVGRGASNFCAGHGWSVRRISSVSRANPNGGGFGQC